MEEVGMHMWEWCMKRSPHRQAPGQKRGVLGYLGPTGGMAAAKVATPRVGEKLGWKGGRVGRL